MTDIQKLSTDEKLVQLTDTLKEYFSIISDNSRSLTATFNAVHVDKFESGYWKIVESLAADLGVKIPVPPFRGDIIANSVVDAAEKKGLDVKAVKPLLRDLTAICDEIKARKLAPVGDTDGPEYKAESIKALELSRNYLNRKSGGGPKR